jgi:hypothetical protein
VSSFSFACLSSLKDWSSRARLISASPPRHPQWIVHLYKDIEGIELLLSKVEGSTCCSALVVAFGSVLGCDLHRSHVCSRLIYLRMRVKYKQREY